MGQIADRLRATYTRIQGPILPDFPPTRILDHPVMVDAIEALEDRVAVLEQELAALKPKAAP